VPFDPNDRILLIGEADLSFAASIIHHHGCAHVTATVLEKDLTELQAKYPHVDANITTVRDTDNRLVFAVDATKQLPTSVSRPPHDRIIFNFPHVGGKSTDVNRQVRYNQELLVSFFQRALPALAPRGSIIVTLFEGEPYTLWNIKDLGRHVGLQVERSFAFQASVYPGYHHARTLGVVKNKKGESGGGWKGEERPARSYIFMRKGEVPLQPVSKKRQRNNDDSSDDDNDE
jgi:25S rRNA (uracil2634-N3)-methyltransferase